MLIAGPGAGLRPNVEASLIAVSWDLSISAHLRSDKINQDQFKMRDAMLRLSIGCNFVCAMLLLCNTSAVALQGGKPSGGQVERTINVPKELVRIITKDEGLGDSIKLRSDGTADNLTAVAIDLNGDGIPELIVSSRYSLCSPTGNCMHWIYQKTGTGYRLLLRVGSAQFVDTEKTVTNGFHDITAAQHESAFWSFWRSYGYDGTRYRLKACFDERYPLDDDGHEADKPVIEHHKPSECDPN
jgi:hypothetical protein